MGREHSITSVTALSTYISYFSFCSWIPDKNILIQKSLSLAHSIPRALLGIVVRKAYWCKHKAAGHILHRVRNFMETNVSTQHPLSFIICPITSVHGMVVPRFGVALSLSVIPEQQTPFRHAQRLFSWVILELVKVSISINENTSQDS